MSDAVVARRIEAMRRQHKWSAARITFELTHASAVRADTDDHRARRQDDDARPGMCYH